MGVAVRNGSSCGEKSHKRGKTGGGGGKSNGTHTWGKKWSVQNMGGFPSMTNLKR